MRPRRSLAGARFTSWLRAGEGARVAGAGARPAEPLVLFEFEACPFCRRVREAMTRLDLEVLIRPCPKGGRRHRDALLEKGGKEQFPFLVDPNAGLAMYESMDIVAHLERAYGRGAAEVSRTAATTAMTSLARSTFALVASGFGRGTAGSRARPSREPARPLEFFGYEADAGSRLVREVLCELELAYLSRPIAPGSARMGVSDADGRPDRQIHLVDPNTGSAHAGWQAIVDHLEATYALSPGLL
ncbi:glutathione S-transferase N-terminal domain-containing protein [Myxococcota bacterium]|nr:glutathione S-transferase N-terminal domain-containing protein [Myxococcota bacterium]